MFLTDANNNPTAFTTDIAKEAGLVEGVDYVVGEGFEINGSATSGPRTLYTAKLLGDPIAVTIRVIDAIGFYTKSGAQRWSYIAMPKFVWDALKFTTLSDAEKGLSFVPNLYQRDVIGFMYQREGGTEMRNLFPNYGAL